MTAPTADNAVTFDESGEMDAGKFKELVEQMAADDNEGEFSGPDSDAVAAEDPQPVAVTPTLLFLRNFIDIFAVFKEFSGVGKSVKAPAAKELVGLAAQHANLFTQIELQSGNPK